LAVLLFVNTEGTPAGMFVPHAPTVPSSLKYTTCPLPPAIAAMFVNPVGVTPGVVPHITGCPSRVHAIPKLFPAPDPTPATSAVPSFKITGSLPTTLVLLPNALTVPWFLTTNVKLYPAANGTTVPSVITLSFNTVNVPSRYSIS
jgi:hypothetical protein